MDSGQKEAFRWAMRRTLWAYCAISPGINYCQGMNFIVSAILSNIINEDFSDIKEKENNAIWLFVSLLERFKIKKYFKDMNKVFELSSSLEILLERKNKDLFKFINYQNVRSKVQCVRLFP